MTAQKAAFKSSGLDHDFLYAVPLSDRLGVKRCNSDVTLHVVHGGTQNLRCRLRQ